MRQHGSGKGKKMKSRPRLITYEIKDDSKESLISAIKRVLAIAKKELITDVFIKNNSGSSMNVRAITANITEWWFEGNDKATVFEAMAAAGLAVPGAGCSVSGVAAKQEAAGADYKELIQIITEARESVLDGVELAADNSDIMEALGESVKLLECGLNMARDIYTAYLENENKKLFEGGVIVGAAGRSVPDPAGGVTVPA